MTIAAPSQPLTVLYIAGWGRSGSTLLARMLGQLEDCVHLGELRTLWIDGFKPKTQCGCGQLLQDCGVWTRIFDRGFGGRSAIDPAAHTRLRHTYEPRTGPLLGQLSQQLSRQWLQPNAATRDTFRQQSQPYLQILERLYGAIAQTHPGATLIDDSLHPGHGAMLAALPQVEVKLVHLVRDCRGCAYSWAKRQTQGLGSYSLRDSALGWMLRNGVVEILGRDRAIPYLRVRYEDLIRQPQETLDKITQFAGLTPTADSLDRLFPAPHTVNLGITHSAFGNPSRTRQGPTPLQLDEAWKQGLSRREMLQLTALSAPLLLRYGYGLA